MQIVLADLCPDMGLPKGQRINLFLFIFKLFQMKRALFILYLFQSQSPSFSMSDFVPIYGSGYDTPSAFLR